jgi:hypothetical protein
MFIVGRMTNFQFNIFENLFVLVYYREMASFELHQQFSTMKFD